MILNNWHLDVFSPTEKEVEEYLKVFPDDPLKAEPFVIAFGELEGDDEFLQRFPTNKIRSNRIQPIPEEMKEGDIVMFGSMEISLGKKLKIQMN